MCVVDGIWWWLFNGHEIERISKEDEFVSFRWNIGYIIGFP